VTAPDTIVAIASAPGRGAVGVIRVSGPDVPRIAVAILGREPTPRRAHLTNFLAGDGTSLDEGLALFFPAPASYTGEHVLELQGHGGVFILDLLQQRLLELGCRMARPGEFSERAFLNGKIDIAQAEAIADLIDAGSAAAARAAVRSMQGEFSARIHALDHEIIQLRAFVEAAIDFPDEELELLPGAALRGRLDALFATFDSITAAARQGAALSEGFNVVIAGRPNAGKSSLLNKLAGDEIAIVADLPGTTRDLLRQRLILDGMPVNLTDTAGLRATVDAVEAEGVRRARNEAAKADLVLYILDAAAADSDAVASDSVDSGASDRVAANRDSTDRDAPDRNAVNSGAGYGGAGHSPAAEDQEIARLPPGVPLTLVFNKIDLTGGPAAADESSMPPRIFLSAKTGAGLELLRSHLKTRAGFNDAAAGTLSARRRHLDALGRARKCVERAAESVAAARAFELFAEDLRLAHAALGEITGEYSSDDLLGEIFGSFCIGK
jgi:tRNA modification GTPase